MTEKIKKKNNFIDCDKEHLWKSNERRLISKRLFYVVLAGAVLFAAFVIGTNGANANGINAIKDAGIILMAEKDDKFAKIKKRVNYQKDKFTDGINPFADKLYVNFGLQELENTEDGEDADGEVWKSTQQVIRIGYQIRDKWAIEWEYADSVDDLTVTYAVRGDYPSEDNTYSWSEHGLWIKRGFFIEEPLVPFLRVGIINSKEDFYKDNYKGQIVEEPMTYNGTDLALGLGGGFEFAVNDNFGIRFDTSWNDRQATRSRGINGQGSDKHFKTGLSGTFRF